MKERIQRNVGEPLSFQEMVWVGWLMLFAGVSFTFEHLLVSAQGKLYGMDDGWVKALWLFYAETFDPLFLQTPTWLVIMCGIDAYIFGPLYLLVAYLLVTRNVWYPAVALFWAGAVTYSTVVYFSFEVLYEGHRADLLWVFVINCPWTVVPFFVASHAANFMLTRKRNAVP
mmetsp:Transcript_22652/g.63654  ORF Transcript_22652/g.63654 Transcript_22652/m.63654 type:complete len:171 (+) Transcript_22652:74-586(+)